MYIWKHQKTGVYLKVHGSPHTLGGGLSPETDITINVRVLETKRLSVHRNEILRKSLKSFVIVYHLQ